MSLSGESLPPTPASSPVLPTPPPDDSSDSSQGKQVPMTFEGYEEDPVEANGLASSPSSAQNGELPEEAGAILEMVDFCSKTTARSQHWSTLSVDSDIQSAVDEFLMATTNQLFKRMLRENFKEVSRWLGARVQVEREGWMLKSRLAMQEIEGHRHQHLHAERVLAECATHVKDVLETLHVQPARLEELPSDDCHAALVAGVELLGEVCTALVEERTNCLQTLGLENQPQDSLLALLDRFLQEKESAFASHRKTCTARQKELEEENARLCEEVANVTRVVSQKQQELEAILEQLRRGETSPPREDKSVCTEHPPSTPSSPSPPKPQTPGQEVTPLPLPSTSSSSATQTSDVAAGDEAGEGDWEDSGIHITEEKLQALKQRARQLEASLHSAISSMESLKSLPPKPQVNGASAASGVLHGFSALSVLHYSQCERDEQSVQDKSKAERNLPGHSCERSRAERVKSERNHPSWGLDKDQGERAKRNRVKSERNHPSWTLNNGLGDRGKVERTMSERNLHSWSLSNSLNERGQQERASVDRHPSSWKVDLSPSDRGRLDRSKSEKHHPSWRSSGGGEKARMERGKSDRGQFNWTDNWRKASFEVISSASTNVLSSQAPQEPVGSREGRSEPDKTSRISLGGGPPELSKSAQIVSYGPIAGGVGSGRTVRPRQVDRCLRCQQLYSRTDNHKLACCYHPKGKERREKYSPTGQLQKVSNVWTCCQRPDDSEGCCFGQHI